DWVEVPAKGIGKDGLTLKLPADDLSVRGRILTLEGKPVPGARVQLLGVMKNPNGDLTYWIEGVKKGYWYQWRRRAAGAAGVTEAVTTDKEGRFVLAGVGRERLVSLRLTGPGIEFARFQVMTRKPPVPVPGGHLGVYAATFKHLAAPGRTATGTVKDKKTGKPL